MKRRSQVEVDLDPMCLGTDGLVSDVLPNPDSNDHHDEVVYARLLERALIPLVTGGQVAPRG